MQIRVGDNFDNKYELLEHLGSGALGSVYKARQLDCNRIIALKILHEQPAADPEFYSRFLREAQVLSQLSHINIVTIYNIGLSSSGVPYLAIELVKGRNLYTVLSDCQLRMPTVRALKIIKDAALALDYVHDHEIIHRDLKPSNIVLTDLPEPDTVKIIDFGLARVESTGTSTLTQTGELIGTAEYMSPEQCMGQRATKSSDIYALSVCLYELLTGNRPFTADAPIGVLYKQINEKIPTIKSSEVERFDPILNKIMQKGMAKSEANRYQSMKELAGELEEALEQVNSSEPSLETVRDKAQEIKRVLLILLVGAFSTLTLLYFGRREAPNIELLITKDLELPAARAKELLLDQLKAELAGKHETDAQRIFETVFASAGAHAWSSRDRADFAYRGFVLWKQEGQKQACLRIAVEALKELMQDMSSDLSRGKEADKEVAARMELVSTYLLENPPEQALWKKINQILQQSCTSIVDGKEEINEILTVLRFRKDKTVLLSIEAAKQSAPIDSERAARIAHLWLILAHFHNDADETCKYANQCLLVAGKYKLRSMELRAHVSLAKVFNQKGNIQEARKQLSIARELSALESDPVPLLELYEEVLHIALEEKDWTTVFDIAEKMQDMGESFRSPSNVLYAHVGRCYFYLHKKDWKQAKSELAIAQDLAKNLESSSWSVLDLKYLESEFEKQVGHGHQR